MTPLTWDQARALGDHLAQEASAVVTTHDDGAMVVAGSLLRALASTLKGAGPVVDAVLERGERTSVTLPTPLGPIVVLARSASASPVAYARTAAHEAVHAVQIEHLGGLQATVDYLGSGELRAVREADAYAAGLWVEFLLTGELPAPDPALASIAGGLYHLDPEDVALARGVIASHLTTISAGLCPPLVVAWSALRWLRANAPDALAVDAGSP